MAGLAVLITAVILYFLMFFNLLGDLVGLIMKGMEWLFPRVFRLVMRIIALIFTPVKWLVK